MQSTTASDLAALFTLMAFLFVLMVVVAVVSKVREIRRASTWPETTGKVIATRVKTTRKTPQDQGYDFGTTEMTNEPYVEYEYKVEGRKYRCDRITVGARIPANEIEATLARYPVGKTVTLFYDPANPHNALLERTLQVGMMVKGGAAFMFVCIGVPLIALLMYSNALGWLSKRISNPSQAPLVAATAFLGVGATWFTVVFAGMVRKANTWPTTQGRITFAGVEAFQSSNNPDYGSPRTVYKPAIIYAYEVNGHQYSGDRLTIGVKISSSIPGIARLTAARYPVGTEVEVHYDPKSPGESVLKPRSNWHYLLWVIPLPLFAFSWALATGKL